MFGARKKRVALKYNSTTRLFFAFYNLMLFTAVLFFFDGFSALGSCRYPNLSEFCKAFMVDETEIVQTLKGIDYEYDTTRNQFI